MIEKVTLFITRPSPTGGQLLLIRHPYAGIQIPAGTVEAGENPASAALREVREETGLTEFCEVQFLAVHEEPLPGGSAIIETTTQVYARPHATSFDWACLPRGITVACLRQQAGFTQVDYHETDALDNPGQISYRITGWVPNHTLTTQRRRSFFLLNADHAGNAHPDVTHWHVSADGHRWELFWAHLADLPPIVPPQHTWIGILLQARHS